jgi:hypothetical protein
VENRSIYNKINFRRPARAEAGPDALRNVLQSRVFALNHRSAAVMRAAGMTSIEASPQGDLRFRADRSWQPHPPPARIHRPVG